MAQFFFMDHDLREKPEFLRIVRNSGLNPLMVRGAISAWFELVNKHAQSLADGSGRGLMRGYQLVDLLDLIGLTLEFWEIVVAEDWIEESEDGLIVAKCDERFPLVVKRQPKSPPADQPKRPRGRPRKHPKPDEANPSEGEPTPPSTGSTPSVSETPPAIDDGDAEPTETAGSITPVRPTASQRGSQFDKLTIQDLSVCGKLLAWIADCACQSKPLVLDDEWHRLRVVAAGHRATTGVGVREPMALFKSIVGKRQWTKLEPDDLQFARNKLATFKNLEQTMRVEYRERAGPGPEIRAAPELLAGGFGSVPVERSNSVDAQRRAVLEFARLRVS
jgi:hypothetical protein